MLTAMALSPPLSEITYICIKENIKPLQLFLCFCWWTAERNSAEGVFWFYSWQDVLNGFTVSGKYFNRALSRTLQKARLLSKHSRCNTYNPYSEIMCCSLYVYENRNYASYVWSRVSWPPLLERKMGANTVYHCNNIIVWILLNA